MKTVILTVEGRGDKSSGAWLRDLGFLLVEAGCEINITRAEGDEARGILAAKGLEVAQIVEGFASPKPKAAPEPRRERAGATSGSHRESSSFAPSQELS